MMKGNQIIVLTRKGIGASFKEKRKKNQRDARIGGLRGRRLPGESGALGHWSSNQRLRRAARSASPSGSATRTITSPNMGADGSPAVRGIAQSAEAACVFRFGSGRPPDDRANTSAAARGSTPCTGLARSGAFAEVFHLARPRESNAEANGLAQSALRRK